MFACKGGEERAIEFIWNGCFSRILVCSSEDSYVERLLDCISNGKLAEDRRNAMAELQTVVAESQAAQLAFGAMGFPVLLSVLVLREERDDVEMCTGEHLRNYCGSYEISSANYPARGHGVRAGIFIRNAKALCPHLVILPYDFEAYEEVADQFYSILHKYCNRVQVFCNPYSLEVEEDVQDVIFVLNTNVPAEPYLKGLAKVEREPSCQPISKLEFERRRVTKEDIRDLIFREILEYHPQLLKNYLAGNEGTNCCSYLGQGLEMLLLVHVARHSVG